MSKKVLNSIRMLVILALLLAAAVTPTLADAKTKKPAKRMKISFDSNEASTPVGEPLRPRASNRQYETPGETVRLRAQNIDDIWAANGGGVKVESRKVSPVAKLEAPAKTVVKSPAAKPTANKVAALKPASNQTQKFDFDRLTREARLARRTQPVRVARVEPARVARVEAEPVRAARVEPEQVVESEEAAQTKRAYLAERAVVREHRESQFSFEGEFNSNLTLGTSQTLDIEGQKATTFTNEVVLGFKEQSGWGLLASAAFNAVSNSDAAYDVRELGDPSLIALHPDWYRDDSLRVSGQFRYFAPMAATSKEVSLQHSSYALNVHAKLASGLDLKNSIIGRYFWQSLYYEGDAYMMLQDLTEVTKALSPEFSLGVGQQTRIEAHHMSDTGTRVELVPLARYKVFSKVALEAKAYLPILKTGVVGLAPLAAAVPNPMASFAAHIEF